MAICWTAGAALVAELQIRLDGERPQVDSIAPADGSTNVGASTVITIEFSEPIDPATLTGCGGGNGNASPNLMLLQATGQPVETNDPADACDDSNVVPTDVTVSDGGSLVTLTPLSPLAGRVQHTVVIRGETFDLAGAFRWRRARPGGPGA